VTRLYEGEKSFDVQLRFPEARRDSIESIGNILVRSPNAPASP